MDEEEGEEEAMEEKEEKEEMKVEEEDEAMEEEEDEEKRRECTGVPISIPEPVRREDEVGPAWEKLFGGRKNRDGETDEEGVGGADDAVWE
ncbi:hypothetical protein GW17_00061131, partial [Ensete ventricosum]